MNIKKILYISGLCSLSLIAILIIINVNNSKVSESTKAAINSNVQDEGTSNRNQIKKLATNINGEWALEALGLDGKENLVANNSVTIAVIDSGVNIEHNNIKEGYNVLEENTNVSDNTGHGTSVIELILKTNPNAFIIPIKIMNSSSDKDPEYLAKGLLYAIDKKVDIINISLGMSNSNDKIKELIKKAIDSNIVIVSSFGNTDGTMLFPASEDGVFSVVSRNINNIDIMYSENSVKKSFSAPGVHIKVGDNKYVSGTSYACPFVTASISLIKQYNKNMELSEITFLLQQSCVDGNDFSYGLIKIDKLIEILKKK